MLTGQKNLTTFVPSPEYCRRHISEDAVQYCVYLSEHLQIYETCWIFYNLYMS